MYRALKQFIDRQTWLDTLGDPLQRAVGESFSGQGEAGKQVKDLLNGVWLGHPLHPVLTDVPVGAWTSTFVLDTLSAFRNDDAMGRAADVTLALGLAGAAGSALTGMADWSDTYGQERKVGLLHGLTMVATTLTYAAALVARLAGARSAGVALANTGYALLSAGAYLGGDEVYDLGYGVNHTAFTHGPDSYVAVMPQAELPENEPTQVRANGTTVLLVRLGEQFYALDDTCTHAGCSLAGGTLDGASIICPCHGSQFDLRDGSIIHGPATMPEPHYDVRVQNGMIEVKQA